MQSKTLKVFFHDNCFDGASSAAIFADFYRRHRNAGVDVVWQGVQHVRGNPFAGHVLDGDDNACVDFRYTPDARMTWWFDHHVSAFQPPELKEHFLADDSGQKFYDPTARSCAKFAAETLRRHFGYQPDGCFGELIEWAEVIDGAQFGDARTAVELDEPALEVMTWLEHNQDVALTHRLIEMLGRVPLAQIAAEPWIREPLRPVMSAHRRNIEIIGKRAVVDGDVLYFDLSGDGVAIYNKFIAYYLFPESRYTVGLSCTADQARISVGFNPWSPRPRTHNIAALCERFGGGGHPVVGAVSLPRSQIERAREIAVLMRSALRRDT
jgi:hypothetical protein